MIRGSRVILSISAAVIAATAMPLLASAGATKVVKTSAFTVTVPSNWKVEELRIEKGAKLGKWVFRGKYSKLYVRVGNMRPESVEKLFDRYVNQSLSKHATHLHMESFHEKRFPKGDLGLGFLYGMSRRNKHAHAFKFGVMVVKENSRKRIIYASMGGTDAGWAKHSTRFSDIVGSIDLK